MTKGRSRPKSTANWSAAADLHAFVSKGPNLGIILFPHQHEDGSYVVSMTRFEKDYQPVTNVDELLGWLEKGYRLRMSNPSQGVTAASLISPSSIFRRVLI